MAASSRGLGKGLKELGGGLNSIIPQNPDIKKKTEKNKDVSRSILTS